LESPQLLGQLEENRVDCTKGIQELVGSSKVDSISNIIRTVLAAQIVRPTGLADGGEPSSQKRDGDLVYRQKVVSCRGARTGGTKATAVSG